MTISRCSECGTVVSTTAQTCPTCGAKVNNPTPNSALPFWKRDLFGGNSVKVLIGVLVLFFVISKMTGVTSTNTCEDKTRAWIEAKDFVTMALKAPSTADFASRGESRINYLGDCKHEVMGYVDAQNSFGAKIRSEYDATVQYNKANDRWLLLNIKIGQ